MKTMRRGFLGGLLATVAATALPLPTPWASRAQAATVPATLQAATVRLRQDVDWEQVGPAAPVSRLFTPTSGPLFAVADKDLIRSDDAGATWTNVTLPTRRSDGGAIEVDPTDHHVIYADSTAGLQRSDDAGATWTNIMPSAHRTIRVAASPADPRVVYAAQVSTNGSDFWFLRSTDRGTNWQQVEAQTQAPCGWSVLVLTPHPTDPARLFRTHGCYAGRNLGDVIEQSRDQAGTWQKLLGAQTAFPHAIVGGGGADPRYLIASFNGDARGGGSTVFTSADDGATWTPILEHKGGGTMTGATVPSTSVNGLAYDPGMAGRFFVGTQRAFVTTKVVEACGVSVTNDGGLSWTPLGRQDLPPIQELALGIDRLNLFAATRQGVLRMALG